MIYVRNKNSDTWHFCKNCSNYPKGKNIERSNTKRYELCDQCKSKKRNGNCK